MATLLIYSVGGWISSVSRVKKGSPTHSNLQVLFKSPVVERRNREAGWRRLIYLLT